MGDVRNVPNVSTVGSPPNQHPVRVTGGPQPQTRFGTQSGDLGSQVHSPSVDSRGVLLSQQRQIVSGASGAVADPPQPGGRFRRILPTTFSNCDTPSNPGLFNASAVSFAASSVDGVVGPLVPVSTALRLQAANFGSTPIARVQSFQAQLSQFIQSAERIGLFRTSDVASVDVAIDAKFPQVMELLQTLVLGTSVSPEFGQGLGSIVQNFQQAAAQASGSTAESFCEFNLGLASEQCSRLSTLSSELRDAASSGVGASYSAGMARIASQLLSIQGQLEAMVHNANGEFKTSVDGSVAGFAQPIINATPSDAALAEARLTASQRLSAVAGAPDQIDALYDSVKTLMRTLLTDPFILRLSNQADTVALRTELTDINTQREDSGSEFNKQKDRIEESQRDTIIASVFTVVETIALIYGFVIRPRQNRAHFLGLVAQIKQDIGFVNSDTLASASAPVADPRNRRQDPGRQAFGERTATRIGTNFKFEGNWFDDVAGIVQFKIDALEAHNALRDLLPLSGYNELFKEFNELKKPSDVSALYHHLRSFYSVDGKPQSVKFFDQTDAEVNVSNALAKLLNALAKIYHHLHAHISSDQRFRNLFLPEGGRNRVARVVFSDSTSIHRQFFPAKQTELVDTYSEDLPVAGDHRNPYVMTRFQQIAADDIHEGLRLGQADAQLPGSADDEVV
jgi:hypothetical protein